MSGRRMIIGYAFPAKKEQTFIQPSLISHASHNGIDLVPIDPNKPLTQQQQEKGRPFDCIIHKLYDPEWNQQLKQHTSLYPKSVILDPPESIARLHNRVSMLDVINAAFKNSPRTERVGVPKQLLIHDPAELYSLPSDLLRFPVIAKSLLANGSAKSHQMSMVFCKEGLAKLDTTPILLQEFVNHGGVLFKAYVIGDYVECVKRRSLPNISDQQRTKLAGLVLPFSQISNSAEDEVNIEGIQMPSLEFIEELAQGIRVGLKLNFFNFDVIMDFNDEHSYYVIDINYFPGYAKLHNFEHLLTDFFLDILSNKNNKSQSPQQLGEEAKSE